MRSHGSKKIPNDSKVIAFTRNHTNDSDADDDDGTKNYLACFHACCMEFLGMNSQELLIKEDVTCEAYIFLVKNYIFYRSGYS